MRQAPEWNMRRITVVSLAIVAVISFTSGSLRADDADRIADAKVVAKQLADGKYEEIRKNFDAEMLANLSADKMKQTWEGLIQQTGEFRKVADAKAEAANGMTAVEVLCECGTTNVVVRVVYNSAKRIHGLFVRGIPKTPN